MGLQRRQFTRELKLQVIAELESGKIERKSTVNINFRPLCWTGGAATSKPWESKRFPVTVYQ